MVIFLYTFSEPDYECQPITDCFIIKCQVNSKYADFVDLYNDLVKMKRNGLILLPPECELIYAPKER